MVVWGIYRGEAPSPCPPLGMQRYRVGCVGNRTMVLQCPPLCWGMGMVHSHSPGSCSIIVPKASEPTDNPRTVHSPGICFMGNYTRPLGDGHHFFVRWSPWLPERPRGCTIRELRALTQSGLCLGPFATRKRWQKHCC